jgi:hypothetical protein
MPRLPVLTWIGNAAAVLFGHHGAVAQQTDQAGCSRQAAYQHADKVQQAIADAQHPGPTRAELRAEVQALRAENGQLWDWLEEALEPPKVKQRQFAVAAAAMGLSLCQTLALLAILLPPRRCPRRATLGRWVQRAARRAGGVLAALDRACRGLIVCLCLDEIFFRRRPVLMGIEPHSLTWVLGARAPDRSGPTWAKALAPWPLVRDVAADGGSGLERGLALAAAKRREDATKAGGQAVPLCVRLDVFHTRRDGERALRGVWGWAEGLWDQAAKVERAKRRFERGGTDGRRFSKAVPGKAWAEAEAAFAAAERQEGAWRRAVAALAVFRPDGRLNDRAWAEAELRAAVAELPGPRWAKVRRQLLDERSLTFLDRLHEELAAAAPRAEVREVLVALWQRRRAGPGRGQGAAAPAWAAVEAWLGREVGDGWAEVYRRVARVLSRVVRASSAVECVNSVVRMHQARHRNLSQELLDLKRLYWNCRRFAAGKRRKRCPYEHLGLRLPSYDAWELLQMDPEELAQQMSTQELAA